MNRAEMTEIFAVLMIAYPNAEMFKAESQQELKERLAPTITLWTTCLQDVDYWTAQKAVIRVCKTCKFPPTIAEMRAAADDVTAEVKGEITAACMAARNALRWLRDGESEEEAIRFLPIRTQKTIEAMGGIEAFAPPDKPMFNFAGFEQTYERLLRSNPVGLPGGSGGPRQLN